VERVKGKKMTRRPDASEARKNQILDAAMTVFARLGFHEARMDDIVQEAGLSKGTLYWYFKSKEDIIIAISQRLFSMDIEQVEAVLGSEGTVSERLLRLMRTRAEGLRELSELVAILFEFYAAALRKEEMRQQIKSYFQGFHELLVTLIQQGIDRGEFRPIDAEEAAVALDSLFEGLVIRWLIDPQPAQWEALTEGSMQMFLQGLRLL
jgi:AcrR family transcriptional regulator